MLTQVSNGYVARLEQILLAEYESWLDRQVHHQIVVGIWRQTNDDIDARNQRSPEEFYGWHTDLDKIEA